MIDNKQVEASLEAIKQEFPNMGVFVAVCDATGVFSFSTNINKIAAADHLEHLARHLRGECKC